MKAFFFFSTKKKIPRTTADYIVGRHKETGQNKTKSRTGRPKATTKAEDNFIRVTSFHDRRLTALNITVQQNQYREKMYPYPLWYPLWSWPIWQNCCQETTVKEAKQWQNAPVSLSAQRQDNVAVDWRIKVQNLCSKEESLWSAKS